MASPCPALLPLYHKMPRCIHKQKNRPFKFLGLLHQTKCFSISFRRRHSKMMRYIFFGRFSLCLCDHCNWNSRKPRDSTNDCSIISITAVSMKLQKIGKKYTDIILSYRPVIFSGNCDPLPRIFFLLQTAVSFSICLYRLLNNRILGGMMHLQNISKNRSRLFSLYDTIDKAVFQ